MTTAPNYWDMSNKELAAAWREVDAANLADNYAGNHWWDSAGELAERIGFVEDAILQRIGAPDDASGDDPAWQEKISAFGKEGA